MKTTQDKIGDETPYNPHARFLNSEPVVPKEQTETHAEFWKLLHAFKNAPHTLTLDEFSKSYGVMWHGTPWGEVGGGKTPLIHLGTWKAAHEALAARIAGQHAPGDIPEVTPEPRMVQKYRNSKGIEITLAPGYSPKPDWEVLPPEPRGVIGGLRPQMIPFKIVGPMAMGVRHDIAGDRRAGEVPPESIMKSQLKRGITPKKGYYYKNEGEGVELDGKGNLVYSTSAIVPNRSWIKTHEELVKEALERGEHVPAHVLADYPHL